jgi:hypothetical protein
MWYLQLYEGNIYTGQIWSDRVAWNLLLFFTHGNHFMW